MKKRWILTLLCGLLLTVLGFALVGCDLGGGSGDGGSSGNQGGSGNKFDHVHSMEYNVGKRATCNTDGTLEHYHCTECDRVFADSQGYKELYDLTEYHEGHIMKYQPQEKKDATCTQDGNVGSYYFCSRCKKNYFDEAGYNEIENMTISALGHIMEEHAAVEATCTSTGKVAYYACKRCDNYYGDKAGTQKLNKNEITVSKKAHEMTPHIGTPATCLEDGDATYYACSKCEKDYIDEEGSEVITDYVLVATGHSYDEEWSYDEAQHWHAPICEHKDELENIDAADHDMENYACKDCPHDLYTKELTFSRQYNGTYLLSGLGSATDEDIIVQPTYEGKPVVGVRYGAFKSCTSIKSIVLLGEIEFIGYDAFRGCTSLESITLPDGVERIEGDAFNGCTSLKSITLPESVTNIGSSAFKGCTALEELNIPDGVSAISAEMFEGCTALIKYEGGIGYIDTWAFKYDGTVKDVVFRAGTKGIVSGLFQDAYSLKSVVLPNGIAEIGAYTFRSCRSLVSVEIPESVTVIGFGAFWECKALTKLVIPKSVVEIGGEAFRQCGGLQEITVEEGNPNYFTAGNCLIDRENKSILRACSNSVIPTDGSVMSIASSAFSGLGLLESIIIPNNITYIQNDAFGGCESLTSIVIPESVKTIWDGIFSGCAALTVYCEVTEKPANWGDSWNNGLPTVWDCKNNAKDEEGIEYAIIGGVRYALKDGVATVIRQPKAMSGNIVIPATLTQDGTEYSVTEIVKNAFQNCKLLESVVIGDNITKIGQEAFYDCTSLASVSLGKGVTDLGRSAFDGCSALTEIYYNCVACEDLPDWGSDVWQGAGRNGDGVVATIGNAVMRIPNNLFNWISSSAARAHKLIKVVFAENSVCEEIGRSAFYGCNRLEEIELPDSIKTIEDSAFNACSSLKEIRLSANVESVGESVFYDSCTVIYCEAAERPEGWNNAWNNTILDKSSVVWNCSSNRFDEKGYEHAFINGLHYALKDDVAEVSGQQTILAGVVKIPEAVTYKGKDYPVTAIQGEAFNRCSLLTGVVIPDGVTSIGNNAFYGCSALASMTIPDSVTHIGQQVFIECNRILEKENGVHYVGKWAVGCTERTTEITLRKGTVGIADYAFTENGSSIKTVNIPNSVLYMGDGAFYWCTSLSSIKLSKNLTVIPRYAFYNCRPLTSIVIPDGVTYIGAEAFGNCDWLGTVVLPATLTEVDGSPFYGTRINKLYLMGTQEDLQNILDCESMRYIHDYTWYCYSKTQPTEEGNFWHYDDDGVTPVVWTQA